MSLEENCFIDFKYHLKEWGDKMHWNLWEDLKPFIRPNNTESKHIT